MREAGQALAEQLAAAMAANPPWPPADPAPTSEDDEIAAAEAEVERLAAAHPELAAACRRLVALHDRRERRAQEALRRRLDSLHAVHAALARLHALEGADAMVARAPHEVAEACGFDRVVLYQVRDGVLLAEAFYVRGDPRTAERLLAYSRLHPLPLAEQVLEREMARRRIPMAVQDAFEHPRTFKPLAHVYDTRSYVAAPIMPEGRVIGFVHADHRLKPRRVDEVDRDALWAFAEGLGHAIARARTAERLRVQGAELQRLLRRAEAVVAEHVDERVGLVSEGGGAASRAAEALIAGAGAPPALAQLSPREREVLDLLARGASNAQIAAELVIADETAKTHVKRILRKLGAASRLEAATIWLRAQGRDGGGFG